MNAERRALPGPGDVIAMLGKGSAFEGKLTFDGTVRIDGRFRGEVSTADTLVIGDGAEVEAELDVGTLILQGQLKGNVRATDLVDVRAPGRILGNIQSPNVMMERGAVFEGQCIMGSAASRAERH